MTPEDYMQDAQGRMVPLANVKPQDKIRDDLVKHIAKDATELALKLERFRLDCMTAVDDYVDLLRQEYGVKLGGKKGNVQLISYDGTLRLTASVDERLDFGPELTAARELITECLAEWSADSRPEIQTLIQDAFREDKQGRLSASRILGLRRLDITDARWQRAMTAISDAVQVVDTKRYIRVHRRPDADSRWEQII